MPLILIVDDEMYQRTLIRETLASDESLTFAEAENGRRALEIAPQLRPDVVILDIRMEHPETGWSILEMLQLDRATARIPVIVCSADAQFLRSKGEHLRERGYDTLEKPFNLEDLLQKVEAAELGKELEEIRKQWEKTRDRFNLSIQERKTLQEKLATLPAKIEREKAALRRLLGGTVQPAVAVNPESTKTTSPTVCDPDKDVARPSGGSGERGTAVTFMRISSLSNDPCRGTARPFPAWSNAGTHRTGRRRAEDG